MKTIVLEKPGRFTYTQTTAPQGLKPGEVLARVQRVGMCGTDIHAFQGDQPVFEYPRILGHELGVEVVEVGPGVTSLKPGDRCAVEPYLTCGGCSPCSRGRTNCCVSLQCLGIHTDGGMRDLITLPANKVHRSEQLGFDELALVETLGIGKHAVDRAAPNSGDTVAVIGLGPIGLTVITFAKLAGANVIGIDVNAQRAEAANALLGVQTLVFEPGKPADEQWAQAYGDAPLIVFDATGNRHSMQDAFGLPVNGGILVLVGLVLGELSFNDPEFHRKEMTLLATRDSTGKDFREIISLMEEGKIDVGPWITHRCQAADFPGVFEEWLQPGAGLLKGVVSFE